MDNPRFDRLKMLFGEPFDVGNGMKVLIPTVGDILGLPNSDIDFYQTLYVWIANPTTYRLMLWDNNIDWNKISNYDLFLLLIGSENPSVSKLIFGDVDFKGFQRYIKTHVEKDENGEDKEI